MKIRNVYLTVFLLSVICVLISSINVKPEVGSISLFGYQVGANFTHNLWLKLLGFAALFMYILNPTFKSSKTENK